MSPVELSDIDSRDLFVSPDKLPDDIQFILNKYSLLIEDSSDPYAICEALVSELNVLKYTCEYDLSGSTYDLRKIA